jgi:hypothetical protein
LPPNPPQKDRQETKQNTHRENFEQSRREFIGERNETNLPLMLPVVTQFGRVITVITKVTRMSFSIMSK